MRGELNGWGTSTPKREYLPSPHGRTVTPSDYVETTKKLRDRVLSSKPKGRRPLRSHTVKEAAFEKRNLDNYPMAHNRADSLRSARGHRSTKKDERNRVAKGSGYINDMADYGKQMFNFAVESAKTGNRNMQLINKATSINVVKRSERKNGYIDVNNRTNGPTPDGSVLYNKRQQIMNTIRIRPQTEYGRGQYSYDDRSSSRLSLANSIREKNDQYRVLPLPASSRPGSELGAASYIGSDYIMIPREQTDDEIYSREVNDSRRTTMDTFLSEDNESESFWTDQGHSEAESCLSSIRDGHSEPGSCHGKFVRPLLPPTTTCQLRLVSLDEESSSESEMEEMAPPVVKKQESIAPKSPTNETPAIDLDADPDQMGDNSPSDQGPHCSPLIHTPFRKGKNSASDAEPEPIPVKVKVVLKGPHCWVDDATVSSDQSDVELEDVMDVNSALPDNVTNPDTNVAKQTLALKTEPKLVKSILVSKENVPETKDNLNHAINGVEHMDITKEDVKEDNLIVEEPEEVEVYRLPPFLCPSSERKSREAAIKDWLSSTCFRAGNKRVPLV